jgi:hypothetical protein
MQGSSSYGVQRVDNKAWRGGEKKKHGPIDAQNSEPEPEAACEIHDAVRIILLPDLSQPVHVLAIYLSQWRPEQRIIGVMRSVLQVLTVLDPSLD